ncbi:PKD domain-containing protein [Flammeovirga sp. SubArs3]|uniref:T9SS type B sorting domain-containing protein n=1 Tax=Flammeovirga sp. SubArs3 TaxID=2995316 RepID=UPI00248B4723|nr:PKD domain-containing protein [Flammeovirga sp. SubArs3]
MKRRLLYKFILAFIILYLVNGNNTIAQPYISIDDILLCQKTNNGTINYQLTGLDPSKSYGFKWSLSDITGSLRFTGQTDRDNAKIQGDKNVNNGINFGTLKVEVWEIGCGEDADNNSGIPTSCYNFKEVSVGYYTAPPITLDSLPYDPCIPSGGSSMASLVSSFDENNLPKNANITPEWIIESTTGTTTDAYNDLVAAALLATNNGATQFDVTIDNNDFDVNENVITVTVKSISSCGDTSNDEFDTFTLTFYRSPEPALTGLVELCASNNQNLGEVISAVNDPFTYTWGVNSISGGTITYNGSGTNQSGLTISDVQFDLNSLFIDVVFDVNVAGGAGSCPGSNFQINVQLINTNLADIVSPICILNGASGIVINNPNSTNNIGVDYSWNVVNISNGSATAVSFGNNNSGLRFDNVIFNGTSNSIIVDLSLVVNGISTSCNTNTYQVTLNRQPGQINTADVVLCAAEGDVGIEAVAEDNNPIDGYTYSWAFVSSTNGTFDVTGSANGTGFNIDNVSFAPNQLQIVGTVRLTVTGADASCGTITNDITVTIDKIPSAVNTSPILICADNGSSNHIVVTENIPDDVIASYVYSWSYTLDNPANGSIDLGLLGTDNSGVEFNTVTFNGDITSLTGTLHLDITGSTCSTTTTDIPFTVFRRPDILNITSVDLCAVDGINSLLGISPHTENFSGFDYDWSFGAFTGGSFGYAEFGNNESGVNFTNINFDANSQQITTTLNVVINGLDATCGNTMSIPVTIDRSPDQHTGLSDFETCLLNGSTPIIDIVAPYTDDFPAIQYAWTVTTNAGGSITTLVNGNDNSGLRLTGVTFGTGEKEITGTITVSVTGAGTNCTVTPQTFNFTIHRLPDGLQISDVETCQINGANAVQILPVNTDIVTDYSYSWLAYDFVGGSFDVTTTGSDFSGVILNNIAFGANQTTITATLRGSVSGMDASCAGNTEEIIVTIHRIPDAFGLTDPSFCLIEGATSEILALEQGETLTGYTYNWTITNVQNGTIATSQYGTQNSGLQLDNVTFNDNQSVVTAEATLTVTGADTSCSTLSNTLNITIYRIPDVNALTSAINCAFNPDANLQMVAPLAAVDQVVGATYAWTVNVTNGGTVTENALGTDGSGLEFTSVAFTGNSTSINGTLDLQVTGLNASCGTVTTSIPFTVYRKPDQLALTSIDICATDNEALVSAVTANTALFIGYDYVWSLNSITGGSLGFSVNGPNNSGVDFENIDFTDGSEVITASLDLVINGLDATCGNTVSIPVTINRNPDALANLTDFESCVLNGAVSLDVITASTELLPTINYSWSFVGTPSGGTIDSPLVGNGNNSSGLSFTNINFATGSNQITGTVQVSVTGLSGACATSTETFNFTIHRLPDGLQIADTEICAINGASGIEIQPLNTEIVTGYNYKWSISGFTGGTADVAGMGADGSQVIINNINFDNGSNEIIATVRGSVSGMDASCAGATKDITLTINRIPDVINQSDVTFCLADGAANEIIAAELGETLTGYTYTWNVSATGGTVTTNPYGDQGSGLELTNVTFNAGVAQIVGTATITVTGADATCGTLTNTFTFTINRLPDTLPLASIDQCLLNGASGINIFTANATPITDFTYSWSFVGTPSGGTIDLTPNGGDFSGLDFDNVQFTGASNQIRATLRMTVTSAGGGCTIAPVDIPVEINRIPDMTRFATPIEFCAFNNDTDVSIYTEEPTAINGFTYTWTKNPVAPTGGDFTLDASGNNNSALEFDNITFDAGATQITGFVDLVISGPDASCGTFTQSIPFTIHYQPDILKVTGYSISLCSRTGNTLVTVQNENSPTLDPDYTYVWNLPDPINGGNFTISGTGADNSGLVFNNVNFDVGSDVITTNVDLTITGLSATCGSNTMTIPVTIDLVADPVVISMNTLCVEEGENNVIAHNENLTVWAGVTSTWDVTITGGGTFTHNQFGYQNTGLEFNDIQFNDGSDQITGTVQITQTTGCPEPPIVETANFTIFRRVNLDDYTTINLCSFNNETTAMTGYLPVTESIANTTYTWQKLATPTGGDFDFDVTGDGSGVDIKDIVFTSGSSQIVGELELTVTTACNTETKIVPVVIDRKVDLNAITFTTLCTIDGATGEIILAENSENISGFTYDWSTLTALSGGTFDLVSFGVNDSGLRADNINFADGSLQITADVSFTLTGSCDASSVTKTITINRIPDVTTFTDIVTCTLDGADGEILFDASTENLTGLSYDWSIRTGTLSGGSASLVPNGNQDSGLTLDDIIFDKSGDPTSNQITFTVDLEITGGCQTINTSFDVTIDRAVDLSLFPNDLTLCELDGATNISVLNPLAETVTGLDYVWSKVSWSGGDFDLTAQGTDNSGLWIDNLTFDTGSPTITGVIRVENTNGCAIESKDINITIGRMPSVANVTDIELCVADGATNVVGITELGEVIGTYDYVWSVASENNGDVEVAGYGSNNSGLEFTTIDFNDGEIQITGQLLLTVDNACGTYPLTINYTLNREPDVSTLALTTLCSEGNNGTGTLYTGVTETLAGWSYDWQLDLGSLSGGSFAIASSGNLNSVLDASDITFDTNSAQITANIILTVSSGTCSDVTTTLPVVIDRKVDLTSISLNTLCVVEGATSQELYAELPETIPGFTYNWGALNIISGGTFTVSSTGNNASNLVANAISFDANSLFIDAEIPLQITGSCDNSTVTLPIRINRQLDISAISNQVFCTLDGTASEVVFAASSELLTGVNYDWQIQGGVVNGGSLTLTPNGNNNTGLNLSTIDFSPSSDNITFTVDLTVTGGCQDQTTSFDVLIERKVDMDLFPNLLDICELEGATNIEVVSQLAETVNNLSFTWEIEAGSLNGGTFEIASLGSDASGLEINNINFDLLSSGITANLKVTNNSGCSIESKVIPITIGRMPEATNLTSLDLCLANNGSVVAIPGNAEEVTGYVYTWTVNVTNGGGTVTISQGGNNDSELTFDNVSFASGSSLIEGIIQLDVANACGNYPLNIPLTINRSIDAGAITLNTICAADGDANTYEVYAGETEVLPGFTFNWILNTSTITNGSFEVRPKGNLDSGLEVYNIDFDDNQSQITGTVTYEIVGPCETIRQDYTITIDRKIDVTTVAFNTLCVIDNGTGELFDGVLENIPGFDYTWGATPINVSGGTFDIVSNGNMNSVLVAENINFSDNSLTINAEIPLEITGDCDAGIVNIPVTIQRIPDLSGIADQELCLLDGTTNEVVFAASTETLSGVSYSWNIVSAPADASVSISGMGPNNSGLQVDMVDFNDNISSVNFDVQLSTIGGCATQDTTFNITINRQIDMSLFPDAIDICVLQGETGLVAFAGLSESLNGIDYTWEIVTGTVSGGTFEIEATGTDLSGLNYNAITFGTSEPEIDAILRVSNNSGCNLESKDIIVEIGRMPEATTIPELNLCLDNGATNVVAIPENSEAVTGYVYTWDIINIVGGTITHTQGGNNLSELVLTSVNFNTNASQITGTITLDVAGACGNYPLNLPLVINRTVDPSSLTMNTICSFDDLSEVHELYTGQMDLVSSWAYIWSLDVTSLNGGTFDISTKGNGSSGLDVVDIDFTDGSSVITGDVTLSIGGACSTVNQVYTVTINRKVGLDHVMDFNSCTDGLDTLTLFTELSDPIATVNHTWSETTTGGTFTLLPTGTDDSGLQLINVSFDPGSSIIQGTITVGQTGGCDPFTKTIDIELSRSAEFDTNDDITICSEATTSINGIVSDQSLYDIQWNVVSVDGGNATATTYFNGFNGISSNTITGLTVDNTYFGTGSGIITAVFELTATNKAYPTCISTHQYTVNFTRIPEIVIPDATAEGCSAVPVIIYPFGTEDFSADYLYDWTIVSSSITGASTQGINNITSIVNSFTDQNLSVTLVDGDYLNVGTQQITFDVDVKVSNRLKDCTSAASTKRYSFTIHRSPLVGLPTVTQESCEDGSLVLNSAYVQQSNITYSWQILNEVGGSLQGNNANGYYFTVNNPTFNTDSYEVTADVVLTTVNNAMPSVCPGVDTVQVYFQRKPIADFTLSEDIGCARNGVEFDASESGIPNRTISYEWDFEYDGTFDVDTITTSTFVNKIYEGEGNYEIALRITTDLGCQSDVVTRRITIHPTPVARIEIPTLICVGENVLVDGSKSSGGSPEGIVDWEWFFDYDNENSDPEEKGNPSASYQYIKEGTYKIALVITNELGCKDVIQQEVEVLRLADITFDPQLYVCEGQSVNLQVNGGVGWQWDNGSTSNAIEVAPTETQFYYFETFNEKGCARRDSIEVVVLPNGLGSSTLDACAFTDVNLSTIVSDQGVVKAVEWSTGETTTDITVNEAGEYSYKLWVQSNENSDPCLYEHTITLTTNDLPETIMPVDTTFCFDDDATIDITATDNKNYAVVWEDINKSTPTVTISEEGSYRVRMTDLTHSTNCTEEYEITITDLCPPQFTPPTAFTPNGDGLNDTFFIEGKDMLNIQLTIYNRWGEVIYHNEYADEYELRDPTKGWDGTYRGKKVAIGDYIYIITYENALYPGQIFREEKGLSVIY